MVKIPNFGELAGKVDVAGMLNKAKTIINTATAAPASEQLANANEETLKAKVIEIEAAMQQIRELQNQQGKLISLLDSKLSEMASIVATVKAPPKPAETIVVAPKVETPVEPAVPLQTSTNGSENKS